MNLRLSIAVAMLIWVSMGWVPVAHSGTSSEEPSITEVPPHSPQFPAFSIRTEHGVSWLVWPDGSRFFSLGVCQVDTGSRRDQLNPTNPAYAAWQHYRDSNHWAEATLERLKSWGFTTIGAWSDLNTLTQATKMDLALTPVLHMGAVAGVPWWDMWNPTNLARMEKAARDQILPLRDHPQLLGYYSDNEMGWWSGALFRITLEQAPTSEQRQRLLSLLRATYRQDWEALMEDFEPEGAASWDELQTHGKLYIRPGGNGFATVRRFLELMAERYYFLVQEFIRKYDRRALILGDRYQSFYYPEVPRAGARYLDAISSNLNASWNDGTFPRFYLDTLHALSDKPILVGEFYMAAARNQSGSRNSRGIFPTVQTQKARAAGFATTVRGLLKLPYVIGADWFQYYDEPPFGRYDGEDYNFGLVDIYDRPYQRLVRTAARLDLSPRRACRTGNLENAWLGIPLAPAEPFQDFRPGQALLSWNRERGWVPPTSSFPLADLFLCWSERAIYLGLYAQDVVETALYRDGKVPEIDRAEWTVAFPELSELIRARIGAGTEARINCATVRIVNSSGVNLNARNITAIELPAKLFGKERFRTGDTVELVSSVDTHCRGYRTEWRGRFKLARVR